MGAAVLRDAQFHWFLGVTRRVVSPCMLEILLHTLKEALLQAWSYQLSSVELDLGQEILDKLHAGPLGCRSYLWEVVGEIIELLERQGTISVNYAQRSVNLVAAVLAFSQRAQSDMVVLHGETPRSLQLALELDVQTFHLAQQLQAEVDAQALAS